MACVHIYLTRYEELSKSIVIQKVLSEFIKLFEY